MMLRPLKHYVYRPALYIWRWARKYPTVRATLVALLRPALPTLRKILFKIDSTSYPNWIRQVEEKNRLEVDKAIEVIKTLQHHPLLSIIMPCYETPPLFLRAAIASIQAQHYPHWELCLVDDASPSNQILPVVSEFAKNDSRILVKRRTENGHISAASNTAIEMSRGDWIVLMDHDDLLDMSAFLEIVIEINRHPDAQVIYSDEDHIDGSGRRSNPYFKPDFDPDLLLGQNLINHISAYRRELIVSIGGFRESLEGSQDHDLILRASAACAQGTVRHIPAVLYHWRQQAGPASFSERALESCVLASRRAVTEHLLGQGISALVSPASLAAHYNRVEFPIPTPAPKVSILIPTRDRADLLDTCTTGILHRTNYPNLEIIVADNGSIEESTFRLFKKLRHLPNVKILDLQGPFNYSRLNNRARQEASGDIILLLNNDIDVIAPGWLTEMVSHAIRPDVGAVGAKLLYRNNTIQHAGVVLGVGWPGGVAGHFGLGASRDDPGPFGSLALLRTVSAVTGACLAVRRDTYDAVGGLDEENLAVAFNDVDFCLRIRELGYRNVWTPFAELYHYESVSRGDDMSGEKLKRFQKEVGYMRQRWGRVLDADPYWNPNLSLNDASRNIAQQSRRAVPWTEFL
ncbi:MAG: glycosyltransferase family 2 protein [Roseomonas sp.]